MVSLLTALACMLASPIASAAARGFQAGRWAGGEDSARRVRRRLVLPVRAVSGAATQVPKVAFQMLW